MTVPLIIALPGNEPLAKDLAAAMGGEVGQIETREFPDGETYLRFVTNPAGRSLVIVCTLARPNNKILSLLFAAAAAREIGASKVGLVSPYLAYMRQDRRFKFGEAVTSREVAKLLSDAFDWMITVDPHLHRYKSLAEIYRIPARVVRAAPLISQWIKRNVNTPIIVGPDSESEQWVSEVANEIGAPFTVLEKIRQGDRKVEIQIKEAERLNQHTPVLVDDIISTGRTMIEATRLIVANGFSAPFCVAVHGIFADKADEILSSSGARVVTTNSVPHKTNEIDIASLLSGHIVELA